MKLSFECFRKNTAKLRIERYRTFPSWNKKKSPRKIIFAWAKNLTLITFNSGNVSLTLWIYNVVSTLAPRSKDIKRFDKEKNSLNRINGRKLNAAGEKNKFNYFHTLNLLTLGVKLVNWVKYYSWQENFYTQERKLRWKSFQAVHGSNFIRQCQANDTKLFELNFVLVFNSRRHLLYVIRGDIHSFW